MRQEVKRVWSRAASGIVNLTRIRAGNHEAGQLSVTEAQWLKRTPDRDKKVLGQNKQEKSGLKEHCGWMAVLSPAGNGTLFCGRSVHSGSFPLSPLRLCPVSLLLDQFLCKFLRSGPLYHSGSVNLAPNQLQFFKRFSFPKEESKSDTLLPLSIPQPLRSFLQIKTLLPVPYVTFQKESMHVSVCTYMSQAACHRCNFSLALSGNNMDILIDEYILILPHPPNGYFVLLYHNVLKSPSHKHLGCFPSFTITNNTAVTILTQSHFTTMNTLVCM